MTELVGRHPGLRSFVRALSFTCAYAAALPLAQAQSGFGAAIVAGNFNGEQEHKPGQPGQTYYSAYDEFVIAAPFHSTTALGNGAVYVYVRNGDSDFWAIGQTFQPSAWQIFWFDQRYFDAGDGGNEGDDRFGSVLARGDFNGDGKQDLAIGVPYEDLNGHPNAGCVHILFGALNANTRWPFSGKLTLTRGSAFGFPAAVPAVPADNDLFGYSLATGDFNGDGKDDLAVGAPGVAVNGQAGAGAVFVFHASTNNTLPAVNEYTFFEGGYSTQNGTFDTSTALAGEGFGTALAAGNFNADQSAEAFRYDDLAVGAPGEKVGSSNGAGKVFVFHGASLYLNHGPVAPLGLTQESFGEAEDTFSAFGATLATGNFNRGNPRAPNGEVTAVVYDDLAIGAPYEDIMIDSETFFDAGHLHVIYGSANGLRTSLSESTPGFAHWHTPQTIHRGNLDGGFPESDGHFGGTFLLTPTQTFFDYTFPGLGSIDFLNQNGGCPLNSCNATDLVVASRNQTDGFNEIAVIDGMIQLGLEPTDAEIFPGVLSSNFTESYIGLASGRIGLGYQQPNNENGATATDLLIGEIEMEQVKIYFGNASTFNFSGQKASPATLPFCGFCSGISWPPL